MKLVNKNIIRPPMALFRIYQMLKIILVLEMAVRTHITLINFFCFNLKNKKGLTPNSFREKWVRVTNKSWKHFRSNLPLKMNLDFVLFFRVWKPTWSVCTNWSPINNFHDVKNKRNIRNFFSPCVSSTVYCWNVRSFYNWVGISRTDLTIPILR